MKSSIIITIILLAFVSSALGQTTEFSYQGSLKVSGAPANGNYDFEFKLFDAASGGSQQGATVQRLNVAVANGVYAVSLDFGAGGLTGADRYLDIAVRTAGGGAFTQLAPRQQVMSTPYAVRSLNAGTASALNCSGCVTASQIGSVNGSAVTGTIPAASVPAGSGSYVQNGTSQQTASNFNISGTGRANIFDVATQFHLNGTRILSNAGYGNLFVGSSTGNAGSNNTFVGSGAGTSNTSLGGSNSFFGADAGSQNGDGSNNAFFGISAGANNSGPIANGNTFIGTIAGSGNTTGRLNTMLGFNANMPFGSNLINATAIGSRAFVTQDNSLVLGSINGVNGATADTNVGIGTTTPTERLDVIGNIKASGTIAGRGTLPWQVVSGPSQQAQPNNGYMATNDAQVTITLPANPSVGDIVRVSGSGIGGWKVVGNPGQFIIANITSNGESWVPHESIRTWSAVASSADGTKLVATVDTGQIYTSTDSGTSWTPRGPVDDWKAVASSADGTRLVASPGGTIQTSSDSGATWTPHGPIGSWNGVASSADGQKLAAAQCGGQIHTSTDFGVTWTPRGPSKCWLSVASSSDGTKLIAAASDDNSPNHLPEPIYRSNDSGVTWTPVTALPARHWWYVASSGNGNTLIAISQILGDNWISTDSGVNWTRRETDKAWNRAAVSADGTKLVAVVAGGQIYTSIDSGTSWRVRDSNRNWLDVASSADGSKLLAVAVPGQIYTATILDVPNGRAKYVVGGQYSSIELQYVGGGIFLPISQIASTVAFY